MEEDIRADGAESARIKSYSVGTTSYACIAHSLNDVVTDADRANADRPLDPDIDTTEGLTDKIRLRREYAQGSYLFNTTTFAGHTNALTGTACWDDYANSHPVKDVEVQKGDVQKEIGLEANTVIIGREVYDVLKQHPDILDRVKYTTKGVVTAELLATLFQVDRVLVGSAIYNSANEGQAASTTRIWGKYALMCYVTPKPALKSPALGYTYQQKIWGNNGWKVKKWRREELDGDEIEVSTAYDVKLLCPSAGYLLSTVIS